MHTFWVIFSRYGTINSTFSITEQTCQAMSKHLLKITFEAQDEATKKSASTPNQS